MSIILGRSLYKKLQESVITVVEDCQALTVSFIKEGCSRYTFTITNLVKNLLLSLLCPLNVANCA